MFRPSLILSGTLQQAFGAGFLSNVVLCAVNVAFDASFDEFELWAKSKWTVQQLTDHMEHHRKTLNDHSYATILDYALPFTLHEWSSDFCDSLLESLKQNPPLPIIPFLNDAIKSRCAFEEHGDALARSAMMLHALKGNRACPMHYDIEPLMRFMLMLDGKKRWAIFNETQHEFLYKNQLHTVFDADAMKKDTQRFPLVEKAEGYEFVLGSVSSACHGYHKRLIVLLLQTNRRR